MAHRLALCWAKRALHSQRPATLKWRSPILTATVSTRVLDIASTLTNSTACTCFTFTAFNAENAMLTSTECSRATA
eukprot:206268-Pleurochrysis_carterae.AAC.2